MRDIEFDQNGFEDLVWWIQRDRKLALRIVKLIEEVQRTPFEGTGKPEPLKHELEDAGRGESRTNIAWYTK